MILNIHFQICGLLLLILISFFFFRQKVLRLFTERVFSGVLISIMICILLDILSVVSINLEFVGHSMPHWLDIVVCKMYLCSIVNVAFFILLYCFADIYKQFSLLEHKLHVMIIALFVAFCAVIAAPIQFYTEGPKLYTYGWAVVITYDAAVLFVAASIFCCIKYKSHMNPERRESILLLLASWAVAAAVQALKNEWLIVSFAMALATVLMYLKLENPDEKIDKDTGLFNREALKAYMHYQTEVKQSFAAITVMIDNLRLVNEAYGLKHRISIIRNVGEFFEKQPGAEVFLDGNMDFVLVFSKQHEMERALNQIQKRFMRPWKIEDREYVLSVSCAYLPESAVIPPGEDAAEFMRYFALEAKNREANMALCIDEKEAEKKKKLEHVEKQLREALRNDEVHVYFQPIYSSKEGKFTSAEALVRIFDDENRILSPEVFIPIAEQNGMILELGMKVFEQTCRFIARNEIWKYGIQYIEVNLSVVQCMQENLEEQLAQIVRKYNLNPCMINLEITETAAVYSEKTLKANMNRLIEAGCGFSLDDYGSGYSNLSYIVSLPFRIIKFDKELIWSYFSNAKAQAVIEYTISMLHYMGMKIVAEGIEDEMQFNTMQRLQIDYIQGYYFSRPLPKEEFLQLLINNTEVEQVPHA